MSLSLKKEELSFGFNYIIGASRVKLKKALDAITKLEELEEFKLELDDFYYNMPETEDIVSYPFETTIAFTDVKNPILSERTKGRIVEHIGGDQNFIIQALAKKEWFYELLNKRIKELQQGKDSINDIKKPIMPESSILSIDEIYDFLSIHFKIDVEKDEFISEENHTYVTISGNSFNLWRKDLTRYMIGYIFKYFFEKHIWFHKRLIFKYGGQSNSQEIFYTEALKALSDKEREIKKGESSDKNLKVFKSNVEKHILNSLKIEK